MSVFQTLSALAPDPLLGLMIAYREDQRAEKFDLGVGVYKDQSGHTPVLSAVRKAEARLIAAQETKVYEGPRGNIEFCTHIEKLVLGEGHVALREGRVLSFTAPGGCGGLFLGAGLMRRMGTRQVWVSDPTWPNHPKVLRSLGLDVREYGYLGDGMFDVQAALESLSAAARGDGVIIQGPCHNPTGADPSVGDWRRLGRLCRERGLIALLDIAYHGFAAGLDEDMSGINAFIEEAGEALIAYSCSKNFGLYRERTGCFLAIGPSARETEIAATHIADMGRASWSMPPAHGAGIVATILQDPLLRAEWEGELGNMRDRMTELRGLLADAFAQETGSARMEFLRSQKGMFSQLPVSPEGVSRARDIAGIYMPASGRINIAGIHPDDIRRLAGLLVPFLAG